MQSFSVQNFSVSWIWQNWETIEQIDRITRLSEENWRKLISKILDSYIEVISTDSPTSQAFTNIDNGFQRWMLPSVIQ